jgi:predicted nucleotidyltransferase
MKPKIEIDQEVLAAFCKKWNIVELSLFGSVLTDDFRPDSDVDVMVTFAENAKWTLIDLAKMERELGEIYRRNVDLITRPGVERMENYIRRSSILRGSSQVYAAG